MNPKSFQRNYKLVPLKKVFKHNITFKDGVFRTPCINPEFAHHVLIIKQKDLLEVEQVFAEIDSHLAGEEGFEHLMTR